MNSWEEFEKKYSEKFKKVPIYYAFSKEQLQKVKEQLGITNDDELQRKTVATYGRWNYIKKRYFFI